jgi:ribosomal protein S18 acetylase RimI-like enzyme
VTAVNSVSIRWAAADDTTALIPLLAALYAHEAPTVPAPPDEIMLAHAAQLLNAATPHRLAIAWASDGTAVGLAAAAIFVSVSDPRPTHRKQMELKELFVLPEYRQLNVGSALMAWVENEARAAGAYRIDWHVKRDNRRAIAFYQRHGANVVESRASMRMQLSAE